MKQDKRKIESFQVVGIKTRTSNAEEMNGAGKIPALWSKFYQEGVPGKIPGKIDNTVLAVYHDYDDDATAPYSLLIGLRVPPGTEVPHGMECLNIPTQEYSSFTTSKGAMPGIVIEAWQHIWSLTNQNKLSRKYSYDFELYDERAVDPQSAEVNICIALK